MSGSVATVRSIIEEHAVPREDVRLILAVVFAGSTAAVVAAPMLWITTAGVVALLVLASRRATALGATDDSSARALPAGLRRVVQATVAELGDGDAKKLVNDVVLQAGILFGPREATFDDEWDRNTNRHVADLVEAACGVAVDVDRIDQVLHSERAGAAADSLLATRQLFVQRLSDAASALASLYAAGVANGTVASDRVGELAKEIRGDAALTTHARSEIEKLLRPE